MLKLKTSKIDKKEYAYLSPEFSHRLVFSLAEKINNDIGEGKLKKPDIIVGIARGSLAWLKTLADWLNIESIATIRVVHYTDVGKRLKRPTIIRSGLPRVDKKKVLLFDNVVETGKTMKLASDYLDMCGVGQTVSSTLFYKNNSLYKPAYYCQQTKAWIVFYFDIVETIKLLGSRWLDEGLSLGKINERFLSIGLPPNEVKIAMRMIYHYS